MLPSFWRVWVRQSPEIVQFFAWVILVHILTFAMHIINPIVDRPLDTSSQQWLQPWQTAPQELRIWIRRV